LCADLFAQQIDSIGAERVAAIVTDGPTVMEYGKRLLVGAAGKLPAHVDRDKYEGKYKHIIPVRLVCACNMGLALPFSISRVTPERITFPIICLYNYMRIMICV
jgi:hypothetical protein